MTDPQSDPIEEDITHQQDDERLPLLHTTHHSDKRRRRSRKLSNIAIVVLICLAVFGLLFGFVIPHMAQSFVEETLQIDIDVIKLESMTDTGARVRVIGAIYLNTEMSSKTLARKVTNVLLRVAGPISVSDSTLEVLLRYEGLHSIATTYVDDMSLRLAHANRNDFDITSNVQLQNGEIIGNFANSVLIDGVAAVPLQAVVTTKIRRFISLHKVISRDVTYQIPKQATQIPAFNITHLAVQDASDAGISADASVMINYQSPIDAILPTVVLEASIRGCSGELIPLARGQNKPLKISQSVPNIKIEASGVCQAIPKLALKSCKDPSKQSPFDAAMQTFLAGNDTTVYISGASDNIDSSWLQTVLQKVSIPIKIPGTQSQQLARDIVLSDVKLNLPSFLGGGGKPKVSGRVRGVIDIPADISVNVRVDSVHVLADLLFQGKKFAYLESPGWAPATSKFQTKEELLVEVALKDAPVTITNQDVFSSIVSRLFGGTVLVDVVGTGDVKVVTTLGQLEAHQLPIEAKDIEIGGFGFLGTLQPRITDLGVLETTSDSMDLTVQAELDNPTSYEASVSYLDVLMTFNDSTLGHLTIRNAEIKPGNNSIRATLRYAPQGSKDKEAGSRMLGEYLSERQVNVTLKAHVDSIPEYPNLSRALASMPISFTLPVPRLVPPNNDDDDDGGDGRGKGSGTSSQFLVAAKFHLFSSTASFTLYNPLNESITITQLHATATYHGDVVGTMSYGYPITLSGTTPITETTRLPVSWKLPASDILRKAVKGTLAVNASVSAMVSVGDMSGMPVSFQVLEVGASVGI